MKLPGVAAVLIMVVLLENVILFFAASLHEDEEIRTWVHLATASILAACVYVLWTFQYVFTG
jgi:hypothetical protein